MELLVLLKHLTAKGEQRVICWPMQPALCFLKITSHPVKYIPFLSEVGCHAQLRTSQETILVL